MATALPVYDHRALPLHRFTVEKYHQLGELGVLGPEDRVELLDGLIVEKMNQRPIHGFIVGWLSENLQRSLPSGWSLRCQLPITTEHSEPEPDLAIVNGVHTDFRDRHPRGIECRLVIEVADTSLEKDRVKADIYHSAGVQEYWIVNVASKSIERYDFSRDQVEQGAVHLSAASIVSFCCGEAEIDIDLKQLFL
ncbi:MAG: Uma2 family endonuclease [Planctomycetales bacterium]|nr:Uma2 family endonuclease [Planctomycetales bacterium]